MEIERKKLLSELSTFSIGGPAAHFASVKNISEMKEAFAYAKEHSLKTIIVGKGSNTLFSDLGFDGLVIQNKIDSIETDGKGLYTAGGGFSFALLGQRSARDGFSGLEFASGIPATVGGAIFMNAGAQNQETKDTLLWVDYLSLDGTLKRYPKDSLVFSYRSSSFQKMQGAIVTAAFQTSPDPQASSRQRELIEYRLKTQPYKDKSCGCIFRNPTGGSAGALIDQAGLKGMRVGGAEVSPMHANFIVNRGHATAHDVLELMNQVRARVYETSGVHLESEVRLVDSI